MVTIKIPAARPSAAEGVEVSRARVDTLRINEIFFSLQGETSRTGLPTVFVRLTGCPLRCGYCDTAYAFHEGSTRALDDVLSDVAKYSTRYVCVTGGEPLAQSSCCISSSTPSRWPMRSLSANSVKSSMDVGTFSK